MTNLDWVGDGGVFTNLDDFIKWDRNFYDNKLGKGEQSLIELVTTPHPIADGYAFGQSVGSAYGERSVRHTGGWVAYSTVYQRFPERNLSVVVFCNTAEQNGGELGNEVAEIAIDNVATNQ